MATSTNSNGVGGDNDPIVLPDSPPIDRRSINFLLNEPLTAEQRASRAERLRHRRAAPPPPPPQINTRPRATAVIDLTEEPDSPVEPRQLPGGTASPSSSRTTLPWPEVGLGSSRPRRPDGSRHPRRTNSTRISPPMLTRSDSTLMGGRHSIIDLTQDTPEDTRPFHLPRPSRHTSGAPPRIPPFHPRHHHHHHHHHAHSTAAGRPQRQANDEIVELVTTVGTVGDFVQNSLRHYHGFITGSFPALARAFHPPTLDVTRNAFAPREDTPQPAMEAVPPARQGYTRDTHAENDKGDEETIAVCPACDEELAYDPAEVAAQKPSNTSSTAASRKRKRAPGEHHFWALKKCGHVYCADCFENRKPSKQNPLGVGFLLPNNKTGLQAFQEMRCAVDGCETKVAQKGEWVGIFL